MNALLTQFVAESREALESIAGKLMQLEKSPTDSECINELFRLVHTLKGSSGLFSFPEMTRVLHAGEDLMDVMRQGKISYTQKMADELLDTMDFIAVLCDEIETTEAIDTRHAGDSVKIAERLRALIDINNKPDAVMNNAQTSIDKNGSSNSTPKSATRAWFKTLPDEVKIEALLRIGEGDSLFLVVYAPSAECFFQGDDPLFSVRQTPELLHGSISPKEPWASLTTLDAYRCNLVFTMLVAATEAEIAEHFRYVADQIAVTLVDPSELDTSEDGPKKPASQTISDESLKGMLGLENTKLLASIIATQRQIFALTDTPSWLAGRLRAGAATIVNCHHSSGMPPPQQEIGVALTEALAHKSGKPLITWIDAEFGVEFGKIPASVIMDTPNTSTASLAEDGPKFGRRAEDRLSSHVLKVDQAKIDTLMNLIGEMVVSKNSLPYLAQRAENQFGCRELSREIKTQYAVINRIVQEMQDAIMQVRMMPVSTVFQRFPRLVRDTSRKLGKEIELVLEGEETEADKNIIESLADPLIHIVRNSLDHGIELPAVRTAAGKPTNGTLTIRASQEGDRVLIEIIDDGKGISPSIVKMKAFEKGLIDKATLEKISDREAITLVFAAGFSTVETVSDLSGRGVGMDVVRTAVGKVNGTLDLQSTEGKGTTIRISLPLSMAVTKMMIIESDGQIFGVPMETVVETMRIPRVKITAIKHSLTTVLRGRMLPLKPLNALLKLPAEPKPNAADEFAVLVVRIGSESVGLIVDSFRESLDIIQKPFGSVLAKLNVYSGSALMGDGTVLMVLNMKEIV